MEHNVKQVTLVHNSLALLGPRYYNRHIALRQRIKISLNQGFNQPLDYTDVKNEIIAELINNRIDGEQRSQSENAIRDRILVDFDTETRYNYNRGNFNFYDDEIVSKVYRKTFYCYFCSELSNIPSNISILSFSSYLLKQILMTAQVNPVRTTRPVQTERTDSTAVVHQVLMEHNVKQVTLVNNS